MHHQVWLRDILQQQLEQTHTGRPVNEFGLALFFVNWTFTLKPNLKRAHFQGQAEHSCRRPPSATSGRSQVLHLCFCAACFQLLPWLWVPLLDLLLDDSEQSGKCQPCACERTCGGWVGGYVGKVCVCGGGVSHF